MSADERDPAEWIDYQQTEIDDAAAAIDARHEAVASDYNRGLLTGGHITDHENKRFKAYLQGYADALEFAAAEVDGIENLVKYAVEVEPDADGGGESDAR